MRSIGFFILSFFFSAIAQASWWQSFSLPQETNPDYCIAIRGNGESAPAHWGALGKMVEENGLPTAMAGGSSATVSMFFMDSIANNPAIRAEKNNGKRNKQQGLLLKSLPEFVTEMAKNDNVLSVYAFMGDLAKKDSGIMGTLGTLLKGAGSLSFAEVNKAFQKYGPLVNPELIKGLVNKTNFFRKETQEALAVFGKFDAQNDKKLFVRPGLVDFKYFAVILGQIADFYAGNTDEVTQLKLARYAQECSNESYKKSWAQLPDGAGSCKERFREIVRSYLSKPKDFQNKMLFEEAGKNIRATPTTALVKGQAVQRFEEMSKSYYQGDSKKDYAKFSVDFDKELSFGYWGSKENLEKTQAGLKPYAEQGDLKSQKFQAIGKANWFEVLATSPAEPGLASLQKIPVNTSREQVLKELEKSSSQRWQGLEYKKGLLSAGGWSDLHPTTVLKAQGCNSVAYLTRKNGETVFGQQVFIRLTGLQEKIPFWSKIREQNNSGWNVEGTKAADTPWNRLYNFGNPASSFNRSLANADLSICTDWDKYDVFQGEMGPMVEESSKAVVFLSQAASQNFRVNRATVPPDASQFPGCIPKRKQVFSAEAEGAAWQDAR